MEHTSLQHILHHAYSGSISSIMHMAAACLASCTWLQHILHHAWRQRPRQLAALSCILTLVRRHGPKQSEAAQL